MSDVDAGSSGVKVSLSVLHGTLTLNGISGLTFANNTVNGRATLVFTGTLGAINRALEGLRYLPALHYRGPDTLTLTSNDQGNTGSGGAKTDTDRVSITVTAVSLHGAGAPRLTWVAVKTFTLTDATSEMVDAEARPWSHRFYRVRLVP